MSIHCEACVREKWSENFSIIAGKRKTKTTYRLHVHVISLSRRTTQWNTCILLCSSMVASIRWVDAADIETPTPKHRSRMLLEAVQNRCHLTWYSSFNNPQSLSRWKTGDACATCLHRSDHPHIPLLLIIAHVKNQDDEVCFVCDTNAERMKQGLQRERRDTQGRHLCDLCSSWPGFSKTDLLRGATFERCWVHSNQVSLHAHSSNFASDMRFLT